MSGGANAAAILSAVIQAVPVAGAAWVGWRGLNTWRAQLRGQRQLRHAERALARALVAVDHIRQARIRTMQVEVDVEGGKERRRAIIVVRRERLSRAWTSWRHFAEAYKLLDFYQGRAAGAPDVAHELSACLMDLDQAARIVEAIDEMGADKTDPDWQDVSARRVEAMQTFLGNLDGTDDISVRLASAQADAEKEMRAILRAR